MDQVAAPARIPVPGKNLTDVCSYTRVMLLIYVAVAAIGLLTEIAMLFAYLGIAWPGVVLATMLVSRIAGLIELLIFVIAGIGFLIWFCRARSNLAGSGLEDLRYSPGWSVGNFFVPIVNLFVPFRSMRELYNRSHGEIAELSEASVPDVASWWTCHVVGSFLLLVLAFVSWVELIPGLFWTTPLAANIGVQIFASVMMAGSAWLLRKLVGEITSAQRSQMNVSRTFE